jgi:hypothetical protein
MILHIGNYGWARVEIGEDGDIFTGSASYLNDTPVDFLEEFKRCVDSYSTPTIKCDEEGSEFIIVVDDYRTYIISERDETRFFTWEIDRKKFVEQVLLDIESQIDNATHFMYCDEDEDELRKRKNEIIELIDYIRKGMKI